MNEGAYFLYILCFETDNGVVCEKWCNIFLLRELPAGFVLLQMQPATEVVLPLLLGFYEVVFPETAVTFLI